ncbi:ADP-forming succinate--CoA ligase subunit beta [Pseudobdellovibrio sp. HCB154]|uniref:ADP-forming succinate--CoA ligase subunit beta n=1 Tax=Pseudobdellovibrio sp. HCB154 TaxID=3386277 RepID=UPI003917363F
MNIHEYQAKEVLRNFGVATLKGKLALTPDEAVAAAKEIGGSVWVVKAQIHAGGRGKGGGVKVAKSLDEVRDYATKILGMTLVTHQTGPEGKKVHKVFIEQGCNIAKEYYVACLIDRETGRVAMMASSEGGMDIEEVAEHNPSAIKKVDIDPVTGLGAWQARELAFAIGMAPSTVNKAVKFMMGLYEAFVKHDCSIAEINPLVVTKEDDVICLDAKMNFDSNSLYRQPKILEMRDLTEEEATEIEASKFDLAFIKLDGSIGCLVNGAGLAMATLDIIKLHGASPANFLDVGGGANKEKVTNAFKIILKDKNVKGILVNIFGGIMKCDVIAEGVIAASKEVGLKVPLVVRLEGTNVELGKKILAESGLNIIPANDLTDAAKKITAAIK